MKSDIVLPPDQISDAWRTDAQARRVRDLIFDQAPLGMALVDISGLLLRVNAAGGTIVGRPPEALAGLDLSDVVHRADCGAVKSQLDALVAGRLHHLRAETRLVRGDGVTVWVAVHASCVRETDGSAQCVIAQIEDITERRAAAVALAEAEARFRTTFEMAPIGMILTDVDGLLLRVNPAFGAIVGHQPAALVGTSVRLLTHPDDLPATTVAVDGLVEGMTESLSLEKRYLHRDGHDVWVSVSASCVRDARGLPQYLIAQVEDVTERREMRERLAHAAIHDPLTNLPNRELFVDRLEMALRRARRSDHRVAVMFIDLDRFKLVNDSLGHEVGDRLLQAVAERMAATLRANDTLARYGGDEFAVLCDEVTNESHALEIAERMTLTMRQPLTVEGGETFVSFSLGIALSTDEDDPSTLLRHADIAMYRAKESGRARIEIYAHDDHDTTRSRLRTAAELDDAIASQDLEICYQPLVDLDTRTMVGIQGFVRWQHRTRGLLIPEELISLVADRSLVVRLGAWALEETCRQAVVWNSARTAVGLAEDRLNVSLAVGALQLSDPGFPALVARILETTGLDPDRLWLGFNESTLARDAESVVGVLRTLRHLGLHLGVDGFGTGYSSLAYLKRCPVEALKVHRSFVRDVDRRSEDTAVVRAVMSVGEALGLLVLADGVDRWEQVIRLQALGCRVAQGNLLGKPLSARAIGAYPTDDLGVWHGLLVPPDA